MRLSSLRASSQKRAGEQLPYAGAPVGVSTVDTVSRPRRRRLRSEIAYYFDVLVSLTASDLRDRYGRGRAPFLKWLLDPFAVSGIYLLLVAFLLNRPGGEPGLVIVCAVVPFQLIMMAVVNGMGAISGRRGIVLNMGFPRVLIPLSSVFTDTSVFAASFVLIAAMMAGYAVVPTTALAWLPPVVVLNFGFALACAYPASLFGAWFSEFRVFAASIVRTLFFLAPGLVTLAQVHGRAHDLVKLNPLTGIFEAYRSVFLYGHRPALWELAYPLVWTLVLAAAFVPLYAREQRHFAKLI